MKGRGIAPRFSQFALPASWIERERGRERETGGRADKGRRQMAEAGDFVRRVRYFIVSGPFLGRSCADMSKKSKDRLRDPVL